MLKYFKIANAVLMLILCFISFIVIKSINDENRSRLRYFNGIQVEHIFFHPLIVFEKKKPNAYISDWFVTHRQFIDIVDSLYERGYVLINLSDAYDKDFKPKDFLFPKNKKPLIISVDDLNYYSRMVEYGTTEKLVVYDNKLYSYIANQYMENVEVVTYLNTFIKQHPDFSYNGAKGIIAVTGYKGILGYQKNEYAIAKKVADWLKRDGWVFASHGYAHLAEPRQSDGSIIHDLQMWQKEVEPVVGKTNIHIFPFGESLREGHQLFKYFEQYGFDYYFGVNYESDWKVQSGSMYGNRIPIDGKYLRGLYKNSKSSQFFNIDKVKNYVN
jgi:peptidoglycan/xylan/chitin deacetylase (PgdA/CDA1 family)